MLARRMAGSLAGFPSAACSAADAPSTSAEA